VQDSARARRPFPSSFFPKIVPRARLTGCIVKFFPSSPCAVWRAVAPTREGNMVNAVGHDPPPSPPFPFCIGEKVSLLQKSAATSGKNPGAGRIFPPSSPLSGLCRGNRGMLDDKAAHQKILSSPSPLSPFPLIRLESFVLECLVPPLPFFFFEFSVRYILGEFYFTR